jgi:hypothetical protein
MRPRSASTGPDAGVRSPVAVIVVVGAVVVFSSLKPSRTTRLWRGEAVSR